MCSVLDCLSPLYIKPKYVLQSVNGNRRSSLFHAKVVSVVRATSMSSGNEQRTRR